MVSIFLFCFQDRPVRSYCWCWLASWRIFRQLCWRLSWTWLACDTVRVIWVTLCPGQMDWIGFIATHGANISCPYWDKTWRTLDRTRQRSVHLSLYPSVHSCIPLLVVHLSNLFHLLVDFIVRPLSIQTLFAHPSIPFCIHSSFHPFVCPSFFLSLFLSFHLFILLSIHPSGSFILSSFLMVCSHQMQI